MNNETILKTIADYKSVSEQWAKDQIIENLKKKIEEEMMLEATKEKGGNTAKKRLQSLIRYVKSIDAYRPNIKGCFEFEGKQAVCNGFSAIVLNEKIDGVPKIDDNATPINLTDFFNGFDGDNIVEIKASEVNAQYKIAKAEAKRDKIVTAPHGRFEIKDQEVAVDLLNEITSILGDCKVKVKGNMLPVLLESEIGKAILLPLRK